MWKVLCSNPYCIEYKSFKNITQAEGYPNEYIIQKTSISLLLLQVKLPIHLG